MLDSLRAKLMLIVGTATLAVILVLGASAVLGAQSARELGELEARLVPKAGLGPRLEAEFERLRQTLQDAAAAQDAAALDAAQAHRMRLFELIGGAGAALTPNEAASLRWAIQDYYETAREISRRLIAGETGETLVSDMQSLQARYVKAADLIKSSTRLEQEQLTAAFAATHRASARADQFRRGIGIAAVVLVIALSYWISRSVLRHVVLLSDGFARFATGDFEREIPFTGNHELGRVAREANHMAHSLRRLAEQREADDWIESGQTELSEALRGQHELDKVAERALGVLAQKIRARAAALYLVEEDGALRLFARHGLAEGDAAPGFARGEGLVGQAAASGELTVIDDIPPGYFRIGSGLGSAPPKTVVLLPLSHLDRPLAVLELGLFSACSPRVRELLEAVRPTLVSALGEARARAALNDLLEQTQRFAAQLAVQEEELRENNLELQTQQHELYRANEELELRRENLTAKNAELEDAHVRLQQKADELARVSSYKSQFLANMSHELRTPLNSMLLLSQLLADNAGQNLSEKQVEHARTIHHAGQDLLVLINQVLDLAKIEAGKQELELEAVPLERFADYVRRVFEPQAQSKGLELTVEIAAGLPAEIVTDAKRVERVLTNLCGNAVKFTERGRVLFRVARAAPDTVFSRPDLSAASALAFMVSDTGIGIAPEAHDRVFAPFEQLESRTNRRYAGTGLGLAIARDSATLLGGELVLDSTPGAGSTFTLYLPQGSPPAHEAAPELTRKPPREVADDRAALASGEPSLLVIEDDPVLAEQLVDIIHGKKLKAVVAASGQEGLRLAAELRPSGIVLDVKLPDVDGWTVMEHLRRDPKTRTIPVHFVSAVDAPARGLSLGAVGYLTKPATHAELARAVRALTPAARSQARRVLVVEDDANSAASVLEMLAAEGVEARHVSSATAALAALDAEHFGCMILDLGLPDMDGLGLLERLEGRATNGAPRVVVLTGRALTKKETRQLESYAEAVILKAGDSGERLLEEIRLFVRHLKDDLGHEPAAPAPRGASLDGVKVLLAEDDMRTAYALSALLRAKGAHVIVAENGREALELLTEHGDVRSVLMDVMMPEMDGYEAMRRLRQDPRFARLPVIALTARAMKGERERCMDAGATDYLTKPVDGERLLSTLHTCLFNGKNGHQH